MMPANPSPPGEQSLKSWKEIAAYLGVSIRTAQSYERDRGLPVRRMPGDRGRVFADLGELREWQSKLTGNGAQQPRRLWPFAAGAVAIAAIAVTIGLCSVRRGPVPESSEVIGDALVVKDANGRELWRRSFNADLTTAHYTSKSPFRRTSWIGDLDGDGAREVLFTYTPGNPGSRDSALIFYSAAGKERWRFVPGGSVRADDLYSPPFSFSSFAVMTRGTGKVVVTSSHHHLRYPTQVALVSSAGKRVSEYWHSGFFEQIEIGDADGDGREEILLGGVSNANKAATLVVLDPDRVSGASVEEGSKLQITGFSPAEEKARIILQESCLTRRSGSYSVVTELSLRNGEILIVTAGKAGEPGILVRVGRDYRLIQASVHDTFRILHQQMYARGELDHPFTPEEERHLADAKILRAPWLTSQAR